MTLAPFSRGDALSRRWRHPRAVAAMASPSRRRGDALSLRWRHGRAAGATGKVRMMCVLDPPDLLADRYQPAAPVHGDDALRVREEARSN